MRPRALQLLPSARHFLVGLALLLLAWCPALVGQTAGQGDDAVAEQRKAALANWRRVYPKDDPPHLETANLLLYGKAPGKTLKEVGFALENQLVLARKALAVEKNDLWPGKLTVFLVAEKSDYGSFVRRIEKRRTEAGEAGSAAVRSEQPHVIAGPPQGPLDPPVEGQAGAQVAVALLKKKGGPGVPDWVRTGFARATWLQTAPAAERSAERRRVLALIASKKYKAADAWAVLDDEEAPLLRGSVIEYLAYSGRTSRFVPFVMGFRPEENKTEPTTADALKAANITPAQLQQVWLRWLRAGR
jgi:hypothetical protein